MLKRIPAAMLLLFVLAILISGPASFLAFWFGGQVVGGATVLAFVLFFVSLYIHVIRRYG